MTHVSGSAWRNLEKVVWALTAPETPLMAGNVAREGGCSAQSPACTSSLLSFFSQVLVLDPGFLPRKMLNYHSDEKKKNPDSFSSNYR